MRFTKEWGTHLPVLISITNKTEGDILELGMGLYSTPFFHWACFDKKRHLISYDAEIDYFKMNKQYEADFHEVIFVDDWNKIDIERFWEIAFVDLSPDQMRKEMVKRLAKYAKYVVIHDSDMGDKNKYGFGEIYPLFKYRWEYGKVRPRTAILSNFVDLTDFKL